MSYSKFGYDGLKIVLNGNKYTVTFRLKNVGDAPGVDLPQVYVHDPDGVADVPVRELKRFDRLSPKPRKMSTMTFLVDKNAFPHFNPIRGKWLTHPGNYNVLVCSLSGDTRVCAEIEVKYGDRIYGGRSLSGFRSGINTGSCGKRLLKGCKVP